MRNELHKIIESKLITTLYQPIVDKYNGEIFAYEALSRGPSDSPLHSPTQLFEYARQYALLSEVESLCRASAVRGFIEQKLPGKLFINVTPETLEQSNHQKGKTLELLDSFSLDRSKIVIELTEQYPSSDETLLLNALRYYQNMGLSIALDDLGAGYSSLRLWSKTRPEFVKIDRHFIQDIDLDTTKQEFVRSFVEIAKSMQCKVIAEGVETEAEFEYLNQLSVDYFQGYFFCRPQQYPPHSIDNSARLKEHNNNLTVRAKNLCVHKVSITTSQSVAEVARVFQDRPSINSIAILQGEQVVGLVQRTQLLGKLSQNFGRELYSHKQIGEASLHEVPLNVDAGLSIEQVSRLVTSRARSHQENDFVITDSGRFMGIGRVIDLLRQVTELQMSQARHANPLTQLPGLIPMNDCIDDLVASNNDFIVSHFDIDNFKPFNDVYGFAKGDKIILALSQSLQKFSMSAKDTIGHIGGDDFLALWASENWRQRVTDICDHFKQSVTQLYCSEHVDAGGFSSVDRYGELRFHPIVSLSVAAIEVSAQQAKGHFEVFNSLSPLKLAAKSITGNSLVINCPQAVNALEAGSDFPLMLVSK